MAVPYIKKTAYHKSKKVHEYTYMQICGDLCGGACCNHGVMSNATFKKASDRLNTEYKMLKNSAKRKSPIKTPILKWFVRSDSIEVTTLNELANTCIDTILKEHDNSRIEKLQQDLDNINQKLIDMTNNAEIFAPVTNPKLVSSSKGVLRSNCFNICMYKDHKKTNLCTVHEGIKDDTDGKIIDRPRPCGFFGSDKYPCPWHHPEKCGEIFNKMKDLLEKTGHKNLTKEIIHKYISEQYNLNKTFEEKILQPYLKTIDTEI